VLIVLINVPFIVMGYYQHGGVFAFKTLPHPALALVLLVISFPTLTQDKLLIAVFAFSLARASASPSGRGVLDAPRCWPCT
jgi:uncharacterized membrane-anchored protein YitT (DUF2179 family)